MNIQRRGKWTPLVEEIERAEVNQPVFVPRIPGRTVRNLQKNINNVTRRRFPDRNIRTMSNEEGIWVWWHPQY